MNEETVLTAGTDQTQLIWQTCCTKLICNGCFLVARRSGLSDNCAFYRAPTPATDEEVSALAQERTDAGDTQVIQTLGDIYYRGKYSLLNATCRVSLCQDWICFMS